MAETMIKTIRLFPSGEAGFNVIDFKHPISPTPTLPVNGEGDILSPVNGWTEGVLKVLTLNPA